MVIKTLCVQIKGIKKKYKDKYKQIQAKAKPDCVL